jgi:hypothetical protein
MYADIKNTLNKGIQIYYDNKMTVADVKRQAAEMLYDDAETPTKLIFKGQILDDNANFASLKPNSDPLILIQVIQPKSVNVRSRDGKNTMVEYDDTATVEDVRQSAAEQLSIKSGTQTQLVLVLEDKTRFKTLDNKNVFEIVEKLSKQSSASASAKKTPKKPTLSPRKRKSSPRKRKSSSPGK